MSCRLRLVLGVLFLLAPRGASAQGDATATVPLRVDFPAGCKPGIAVPVTGGLPFPRGALESVGSIRVLAGTAELPAQVSRTAVWPDGSVKWALVDLVLSPSRAKHLTLEFGPGVRRAAVDDPLTARRVAGGVRVRGGGVNALIGEASGGIDALSLGGKRVFFGKRRLRLVLEAVRVAGPEAFPGPSRVCFDAEAKTRAGRVVVEELTVEVPGPIRARVLVRGYFGVPGWGSGLPERVLAREPAERVPFSLRLTFVRQSTVVVGDHQLIYSGEPDRDFITRWGVEVPGQGTGRSRRIDEPGLTRDEDGDSERVDASLDGRLCWAPLKDGVALIREGFQNRPCFVGGAKGKSARLEFWPREAGPWDLRRYAREWATGESGDRESAEDMQRYARVAARGLAKSHTFVLQFAGQEGAAPREVARALSGRALLVAPPGWYAASAALGVYAPERARGRFAALDQGLRRYFDYFRFSQDLYRWYGKLGYGFWQSRNGEIHRGDRWDRDYGRWGWSLGDGAGRIGHSLLLAYLRTLDRRALVAGEAACRATFDTSMVHTQQHLENATGTWWSERGCNHRHNVQPFGCPYIGLRGSYPFGQRILASAQRVIDRYRRSPR